MNIVLRAARDAVATVGAAYIPFSLVRVIAYPEFDVYFVGPVEELLGVIGAGLFALLAGGYGLADIREKGRGRFAGSVANSDSEKGNVLFLILIAVALFGALTYAVTNSMRTGSSTTEKEQAKLDQAVIDNYMAAINVGKMRLEMAGCSSIDYTAPADQGAGDKSCHIFHPDGGGVSYQDLGLDSCALQGIDITTLAIGETACGVVYAGTSGGNRIYTTAADQGQISWNNGTATMTVTGATSTSDGLANTNTLVGLSDAGAPYNAANACRSLGADWYLPSQGELNVLYTNRAAIGGFNLSGSFPAGWYWSSSEDANGHARLQRFSDGYQSYYTKFNGLSVRCVRR
jgi:hypothetical protein